MLFKWHRHIMLKILRYQIKIKMKKDLKLVKKTVVKKQLQIYIIKIINNKKDNKLSIKNNKITPINK